MSSTHTSILQLAVVGAGFMGEKHAEFIGNNSQTELAAIVDPFNRDLSKKLGVDHFDTAAELLASKKHLDGVIIVNPTNLHVDTALEFLDANIPILLEKPVAESFAASVRLLNAQKNNDTPIVVAHHRRHNASAIAAQEFIASGKLGDIVAVNGTWSNKKQDSYYDVEWHRKPGGGVMLINLIHDLDLLRFLCGDIVSVQAKTSNKVRGFDVDETVATIFEFENGAIGAFVATDAAPGPWSWDQATEDFSQFPYTPGSTSYQILGTGGSLGVPDLAFYHYNTPDGNWFDLLNKTTIQKTTVGAYDEQLRHFVAVIRKEEEPKVTVADAAQSLAVIEAAQESATTNELISIQDFMARHL